MPIQTLKRLTMIMAIGVFITTVTNVYMTVQMNINTVLFQKLARQDNLTYTQAFNAEKQSKVNEVLVKKHIEDSSQRDILLVRVNHTLNHLVDMQHNRTSR